MKKQIIYVVTMMVLLLWQALPSMAQRMLNGQMSLEVRAGAVLSGSPWKNPSLSLQVAQFRNNGNYRFAEITILKDASPYRDVYIPLRTYLAEAGYLFYLLSDAARSVVINAGAAAFSGWGINNKGDNVLYDKAVIRSRDGFLYGASGILSIDTYLSDRLVISAQGKARQYFGNSAGRRRYAAGIGLRYNFN